MNDGSFVAKPSTDLDQDTNSVQVAVATPVTRLNMLASILPKQDVNEVTIALQKSGMNQVVTLSPEDTAKVLAKFKKLGLDKVENLTYEHVSAIGKEEFTLLNSKLKEFTSRMTAVQTPGLFGLIDDLSKNIQDAELDAIWRKAVNAKPTLWARFLNVFNNKSSRESLNAQFVGLSTILDSRGKGLEKKLGEIEKELLKQQNEQLINIKTLETSFDLYYQSFLGLREQLVMVSYLEHYYTSYLDFLRSESTKANDLVINNQLRNAEEVHRDIQDKRLVIHKAMLQMPITTQQNANLVTVCKNLLKEIENTRLSSFPTIRSNLLGLGISLRTQQAMMTNDSAQELDRNLAKMAVKVSGDLTEKGVLLSSESRLREAETLKCLVEELKALEGRLLTAKEQSQTNMDQATHLLLESTTELKDVLGAEQKHF